MTKLIIAATAISAFLFSSTSFGQELEEIIVTSQKREQLQQDVPASIAVLDEETFDIRQIDSIGEIALILPGFEYARAPGDSPGVTFRGIGTQAGNVAFDNSIGMFVDGAFLGNVHMYSHTLFDVQRVELIKGTQSTLLGKNTSLGGISIINNKPGDDFGGNAEIGIEAENGGWFADGAVDIPANDQLKFRLAGRYSDLDGWVNNVTTGNEVPEDRDAGVRVSALWEPNDKFDALVTYQYSDFKRVGLANQITSPGLSALGLGVGPALGESEFDDTKASFSSDPRLEDGDDLTQLKLHMVTGTLNYDLGDATLTSVSNYSTFDHTNNLDFDFDNKDFSSFARTEDYWQVMQELRLASNGGEQFDYLLGFFFFHSDWDMFHDWVWGIPDFPPGAGPLTGQLFNGSYTNTLVQDTTAYSVYGQLNWYVNDRFRANFGLRYTHEKKEVSFGRTNRAPFTLWNSFIQAPFPFQELEDVTDNLVSASVSFQYDVTDDAMVYVAAARGGKAGGYGEYNSIPFDPALGAGNPQRDAFVDDERANSYEIGLKSMLLNDRMQLDVAVFHIDVWGLQQLLFTGEFVSSNDRARSTGVDGTLAWQMTDAFRLTVSGAYSDAEDKKTKLRLAQSPRVSLLVNADWEHQIYETWNLGLGGTVRYRSSKFNQLGEGLPEESLTTLALTARLTSDSSNWYANIVADNRSGPQKLDSSLSEIFT